MIWLPLILAVVAGVFGLLLLALFPVNRREQPDRFTVNTRRSGVCLLMFAVMVPVYTQSHYMFLDEPLVSAASDGRLLDVEGLITMGANINAEQDDGGGTPLVAAAAEGHADVVAFLLERGAIVNMGATYFDGGRTTPLQAAKHHPEIAALLRKAGAKE